MENEIEMITAPPGPLPNLPEEIIKEILLRLPARSLWKFRCVSKCWLFLISSYDFAKAHLKVSTKKNIYEHGRLTVGTSQSFMNLYTCSLRPMVGNTVYTGSIYPDVDILPDVVRFDRPLRDIDSVIWLEGSCNGLVCVLESARTLILWNPTTNQYRVLPCSGTPLRFEYPRTFGFGYDEFHDDYKVVEVFHLEPGMCVMEPRANVYSLRSNCWKALLNWPNERVAIGSGVFLNEALHWLVIRARSSSDWAIVSHDLALETFVELPLPFIDDDALTFEMNVLGGCLSVCCQYKMWLDVWLLKEYGVVESWNKVMRMPFFVGIGGHSFMFKPLVLMEDGRLLIKYGSELALYDPNNPYIQQKFCDYEVEAAIYFESLVSPNLDDEVIIGRTMPQNVVTKILLRLPVKSLLRFKSVSKEWLSLISSSYFVKAHLKVSTKNNVHIHDKLIFGSNTFPLDLYTCSLHTAIEGSNLTNPIYPATEESIPFDQVKFDCPFVESGDLIWLVGSCNGLVCVSVAAHAVILWNPTTRKSKLIPDSGTDPDCDSITYGFGYEELHDDYKVVEASSDKCETTGMYETQVKVYSVRTNSWKIMYNWPGGNTFGGTGKFLNGAIHWSVRMRSLGRPVRSVIVSHDLATDIFVQLPMPNFDDDDVRVDVKILNGCLVVCCEHNVYMDIWVMKEYGMRESWTKLVRIPFFLDFRDHEFIRPCPLFLSMNGKILMDYGSTISIYDTNNSECPQFSTIFAVESTTYSESLVSPYFDDETTFGRTLPQGIITEVLLRLPVNSLVRFKAVSKEWHSLISSSYFVMAHLKFSTKNNIYIHDKLIFGSKTFDMDLYTCSMYSVIKGSSLADPIYPVAHENSPFDLVWCDDLYEGDSIWFVGSCNGLVCVSVSANTIILWNPTIRKSKVIPDSGTDLDFDNFSITYALGYDEIHNDYKVVEFFGAMRNTGVYETEVKVYSMRTNSWKVLSNWPGRDTFGGPGKFLNGAIHWSVCDFNRAADWVIVSHDLATDIFTELPLPMFHDNDVRVEVHIFKGCLAVHCEHNILMDIWVMKEYGKRESWTKVVSIPFFLDFRDHLFIRPCPLFFSTDGKILIDYGSTIRVYDPSNPHFHQFSTTFEVEAITYIESLVSPDLDAGDFP
ncbi:uncharacterized protein LOC131014401 [Salvia miltiorrhiza]|uniref:uncharacterized protein LOC131014401 n=1 Tax=Salvia miltiorrhiza TaxID=226208 RepID=UPI0025ABE05F|nr:uncharacterized protein LOC131014401 [Salvia miltiorrhiza]